MTNPRTLDANFAVTLPGSDLHWYDASALQVSGRGFKPEELERAFDRLPLRAKVLVPAPVWSLSRHSAGIEIAFRTDASEISLKWSVLNSPLALDHMPSTGMSGVDLYALDGENWRFVAVARPTEFPENRVKLCGDLAKGMFRDYRLYLPLYNGVDEIHIGVPKDSTVLDPGKSLEKPIVFYGTSITQGGCPSRPGMSYPAILGRRLGFPTVNLGFSGNGRSEIELAALVSEIEAQVYVLDALPNMTPELVSERIPDFIQRLRSKHPLIPIVLVEHVLYVQSWLVKTVADSIRQKNEALRSAVEGLLKKDPNLHLVPAQEFFGQDGEATVDGGHPTDLGFLRMADGLEPFLRKVLSASSQAGS